MSDDNKRQEQPAASPDSQQMDAMIDEVTANPGFQVEKKAPVIIKVVGVGGGGNNAINHMYAQHIMGVSFEVINTDRQALDNSPVPNRLLIGPETTGGLGAGNDPERARQAAEESAEDIGNLFEDDTKMAFITAGMGGGTGTGAAPVVARIAREHGVLTIGIVTIPFLFEGKKKILKALDGADEMQKYVDALLIINNERLTEIYPDLDFDNAFGKADDTLSVAAQSISDLITVPGIINLDFNDVNTTLRDGGVAIISSGCGEGEHRITKAVENALESPLLKNRDVYTSKKVLVNIYYSPKSNKPFKMEEVNEMTNFMNNFIPDVDVIWGTAHDESLDDRIKVTILASGFNANSSFSAEKETGVKVAEPVIKPAAPAHRPVEAVRVNPEDEMKRLEGVYGKEKLSTQQQEKAKQKFVVLEPDEMDNDEIIDRLEKTPAYNRPPKFKTEILELQQQRAQPQPAPSQSQAAQVQSGTISFGA